VQTFLTFTVLGLVIGCIYGLTASGLVVTYTTSGIFNFAHGAVGMFGAYTYWQLTVAWHWPRLLALLVILGVFAPAFGAVLERVLIRPLRDASVDLTLVVTLGLLLFLIGLANLIWKPTQPRVLPKLLATAPPVRVGYLSISAHQIVVVAVAIVVAVSLRLLFTRTRIGIAMRGVVDDPDLAVMAGVSPERVRQLSWAIGSSLAALAGILLAPLEQLNILSLTLLVINGYAAALFGSLRSLPRTAVGAVLLGLVVNYAKAYVPAGGLLERLQPSLPMVFLFVVLLFVPAARLSTSGVRGRHAPRVPGLRQSLVAGTGLLVLAVVLAGVLPTAYVLVGSRALILGLTLLSLVLLTGYSGQVSLCHLTFVGLGAFVMGTWADGSLLGVLLAVLLSMAAGMAVAAFTLRLRGLYLALSTFAFAKAMDDSFFVRQFGSGGTLSVTRLHLPGLDTADEPTYFLLCAVLFTGAGIAVLAVRRSRYGRMLTAMSDSPAACATLGMNLTGAKLVTFSVSAGLAGLSGALFGGLNGNINPSDFAVLGSLSLLLALRIGGITTVTGALLGAVSVAVFPTVQAHVPSSLQLSYLLTGLAAVSIGRDPDGFGGQIARAGAKLRWSLGAPEVTTRPVGRTA
jgi:branched-chain amino acid transport system permease protein